MKKEYQILDEFIGYATKPDITKTDPRFLVSGSQNMLINDKEKVVTRLGYSLYGEADATLKPVKSEKKWKHNSGTEHFLREYNGNLQLKLTVDGSGASVDPYFSDVLTGLSATYPVRFATAWNGTELIDVLLFVNHSDILYEWSGGYGTYASSTTGPNTIVINETIAESHFLSAGSRHIRVLDTSGTWRDFEISSQAGSTFTVVEDPASYTFASGAPVVQAVRLNATTPVSGYTNDTINVLGNQVFIGSASSRVVYMSASDDYTDYSFSTPRVPSEGAKITLDDVTVGFVVGKSGNAENEYMHVFSGSDRVYRIVLQISAGDSLDREVVNVQPIINASNQGAQSQELIGKNNNFIVFLNNSNEFVDLGSVTDQNTLNSVPISDPIRPDFIATTFTNGQIFFDTNSIYITAPVDSKVFIFDTQKKFWQPPQILPIRLITEYGGNLYGHSNFVPETYKLFDGTDDNDLPITFKAYFAYRNSGDRNLVQNFNKFFSELYMTANAEVIHKVLFEYGGSKGIQQYTYKGTESDYLYTANPAASLGMNSLGTNPLGGYIEEPPELLKYRRIKKIVAKDHYEYQVGYECEIQDARFEILALGPNAKATKNYPVKITN